MTSTLRPLTPAAVLLLLLGACGRQDAAPASIAARDSCGSGDGLEVTADVVVADDGPYVVELRYGGDVVATAEASPDGGATELRLVEPPSVRYAADGAPLEARTVTLRDEDGKQVAEDRTIAGISEGEGCG